MDGSVPQVIHIIPGATLRECVLDTLLTTQEHTHELIDISNPIESSRIILKAIQLLLYILSDNADIEDEPKPQLQVVGKKKATNIIRDKAGEVIAKNVGVRIGAAFRHGLRISSGGSTGTGSAKRPHMRRGHWHHYWRGAKDSRELVLKWTAPTMIHSECGENENIVVYPIKG